MLTLPQFSTCFALKKFFLIAFLYSTKVLFPIINNYIFFGMASLSLDYKFSENWKISVTEIFMLKLIYIANVYSGVLLCHSICKALNKLGLIWSIHIVISVKSFFPFHRWNDKKKDANNLSCATIKKMRKVLQSINPGFEPRHPNSRPAVFNYNASLSMLDYLCKEACVHGLLRKSDRQFQMLWTIMNEGFPVVSRKYSTRLQAALLSLSTSHPLISIKTVIPPGMWRVAIWHHQIHTLLCILPDNSIHQLFCLLQSHNSLRSCFWKQGSKFLFFSEPVNPSHSHGTSFCMTEMLKFFIHR